MARALAPLTLALLVGVLVAPPLAGAGGERGPDMHQHNVCKAAAGADGRFLATAAFDGEVRLWATAPFASLGVLTRPDGRRRGTVSALAVSPDGAELAVATRERGVVERWRVDSRAWRDEWAAFSGSVSALAWSPVGGRLAAAGADRMPASASTAAGHDDLRPSLGPWSVRIIRPGAEPLTLVGLTRPAGALAFDPSGRRLYALAEGELVAWSLADGTVVERVAVAGEPAGLWVGEGQALCAATSEAVQCRAAGGELLPVAGARAPAGAAWVGPARVVTATFERVESRERATGEVLGTLEGRAVAMAGAGEAVWVVFDDRAVALWQGVPPGEVHRLKGGSR